MTHLNGSMFFDRKRCPAVFSNVCVKRKKPVNKMIDFLWNLVSSTQSWLEEKHWLAAQTERKSKFVYF
jgi:hypothetical protein